MCTKVNHKPGLRTMPSSRLFGQRLRSSRGLALGLGIGLSIGLSLALAPSSSYADERGKHKEKYSQHSDRGHHNGHKRDKQGAIGHVLSSQNHRYRDKHGHRFRGYARDHHGHRKNHRHHKHHKHVYSYDRHDAYRGHGNVTYIINEHDYRSPYYLLDPFRFSIGLHTDNLDIIFSD